MEERTKAGRNPQKKEGMRGQRWLAFPFGSSAGDWTGGLRSGRQVLHHWDVHQPSLLKYSINVKPLSVYGSIIWIIKDVVRTDTSEELGRRGRDPDERDAGRRRGMKGRMRRCKQLDVKGGIQSQQGVYNRGMQTKRMQTKTFVSMTGKWGGDGRIGWIPLKLLLSYSKSFYANYTK